MTYIGDVTFRNEVALGNIKGWSLMCALGERQTMGVTPTGEDIWRGNQLSSMPVALDSTTIIPTPAAAGEQMMVVSESDADNGVTATGIQTLRLYYVDAAGVERVEDVTLNGTTPVDTAATNIRFINDNHTLAVGSHGVAQGNIRVCSKANPGLVYGMLYIGGNRSLVPHRMVPAGKILLLQEWQASETKNKRCAFRIRSTDFNGVLVPGVFICKDTVYLNLNASGALPVPHIIPAFSIVKVTGWPDANLAEGGCSWWGYLVELGAYPKESVRVSYEQRVGKP